MPELEEKESRVRDLLARHQLDALWLQRVSSVAWATSGASVYVNTATSFGPVSVLFTRDGGRFCLTNNIEAPRLEREEALEAHGWQLRVTPWYEPARALAELTAGMKLGSDGPAPGGAVDLSEDVGRLRARLLPEEGERLRGLGGLCAQAMNAAIRGLRPGQTEQHIAGQLAAEAQSRGVQAVVNLVATDERIFAFRHPLPTRKGLDRYAMLVLGGRRQGLICSITRLVHFGRLSDDLRNRATATAQVDAALIRATRPGRRMGELLAEGIEAYAAAGFPREWQLHHQGGACGYEPREWLARPDGQDEVAVGQGYAWNPSITGAKSEDTILVGERGNEVLTCIDGWPVIDVQGLQRPAILEV
jgi:Xaa-Pro aminopeptidase